jgi:hypothetical protein
MGKTKVPQESKTERKKRLERQLYNHYCHARGIDERTCVCIESGGIRHEFPYIHLEVKPLHMKNQTEWKKWRNSIINLAIKNGGWKLILPQEGESNVKFHT